MNNGVGYAFPARATNKVILGTDGIGADMLEEMRLAYVAGRSHDLTITPQTTQDWIENSYHFMPECKSDSVTWNYDSVESPWHTAFTPGIRALEITSSSGEKLLTDGRPVRVDLDETRAKAAESARKLFALL